ncbi:hypothetical protein [Thalassobacter stenotrophicus]|uniref:Uncharacterized protein n=2 Tax=Thalassobacter stenotrophicus TaxID=266809 RepID=A0A0P1EXN1_9RHOB|nr:hypothetical protein [Thalassobacter stenotrophicus]CUH59853.1 hypothetical protein THS5294_01141 [Thalassobacter stenotrophicus]SHJ15845.1 hypothetical protein SAMN02744035_02771 [Thalassobacter stenotrophicus DSM 16310]
MTRRTLTETELKFARICLERIETRYLNHKQQRLVCSLSSYIEWDSKLSDKQLSMLRGLKHTSDHAKRRDAIARGKLSPDVNERTTAKLNTVYNPISR